MTTIELNNFIPFPGNYFSYYFQTPQNIQNNETLLLKFPGNESLAVEAKAIQQVSLDGGDKIQFQANRVLKILPNGKADRLSVTCEAAEVSDDEIIEFKELLKKWDPEEYSIPANHYFDLIEKTKDKMRLIELIGGAICRPNKYPFIHHEIMKKALDNRAKILLLESCEKQLAGLRALIISETLH